MIDKLKNPFKDVMISSCLEENETFLNQHLASSDVIFRHFHMDRALQIHALLVFIDGLVDKKTIQHEIIFPLTQLQLTDLSTQSVVSKISSQGLYATSLKHESRLDKAVDMMLNGYTLLFIHGLPSCILIETQGWKMRSISEPVSETVVRGPREGFIETLRVNTAMVRRKVPHPALKIEEFEIGQMTRTRIALAYIDGLPPQTLVDEVKRKLQEIDITKILESSYIEECIEQYPFSLFPTVQNTERPDAVAARLIEGRVAILIDGTTSALLVPMFLSDIIRVTEDYNVRPLFASFIRTLRFLGILMSIFGPAVYLATLSYQQELIPPHLFISFLISRSDVPFSLFFELVILLFVFEILKEVGIRMPTPLSSMIPLIGGIILGESAVRAGFASESSIIVVAISGFSGYMLPALDQINALLRFTILVVASYLGMFGITLAIIFLLIYLSSIQSFGYHYTAPYFPVSWTGLRDLFIRLPHKMLSRGPQVITKNERMIADPDIHPIEKFQIGKEGTSHDKIHTSVTSVDPPLFHRMVRKWLRPTNNRIKNK